MDSIDGSSLILLTKP